MTVAGKTLSVANNVLDVYKSGELAILDESQYMHPTVSGETIAVNDVNPMEHKLGVRVKSKNLVDLRDGNYTCSGYKGDGVYVDCDIKANTDYIVSFNYEFISLDSEYSYDNLALFVDNTTNVAYYPADITSGKMTLPVYFASDMDKLYIIFISPNYRAEAEIRITNFQLELGDTATPYTPYISDFTGIEVSRYGKNLFDADTVLPSITNPSYPTWHWAKQADGSFYLGNVATLNECKWFENTQGYKGQMVFLASVKVPNLEEAKRSLILIINYTDGTGKAISCYGSENFITYTIVSDASKTVSYISQSYGQITGTYIKDIMLSYGTDTAYEPYISPLTATATADGTVKGLTSLSPNMTLLTNTNGVVIDCQYYRDIDLYIDNQITDIALTGGV